MKPKMIWANLGVSNLEQTTAFYTALGFKPNGANSELTSFIFADNNFIIHFFLKDILEKNTKAKFADPQQANEVIFTISAMSMAQVDDWAKEVENAGGKLITQPEEFGEGYYGFVFADPDGHRFNVFYM